MFRLLTENTFLPSFMIFGFIIGVSPAPNSGCNIRKKINSKWSKKTRMTKRKSKSISTNFSATDIAPDSKR